MSFEEFQNGPHCGHLGRWNGTNLAVLNLHASIMPPTNFQLNQTYHSRADVVSRFSSWPLWRQSWILEWKQFSNSKSACYLNASHQGWAQSDLLISERFNFSNSKSPCGPNASYQVWAQSYLGFRSRCGFKIFKMAAMAVILDSGTELF